MPPLPPQGTPDEGDGPLPGSVSQGEASDPLHEMQWIRTSSQQRAYRRANTAVILTIEQPDERTGANHTHLRFDDPDTASSWLANQASSPSATYDWADTYSCGRCRRRFGS